MKYKFISCNRTYLDGRSHDVDQIVIKNKDGENVVCSVVGTKLAY